MLKWLRKYSRSWFIAAIIGAIVLVFILWGVGGFKSPGTQEVAQVNGTPILVTAYLKQYQELVKQLQGRYPGELTEELLKKLRLKEQALNRLVDETLILQAAHRMGLQVSAAELREQIRSYPFFQEDGKFSDKRYQMLLARNHLRPPEFEDQERRRLLLKKVYEEVTGLAKVSDAELQDFFNHSREEVNVQYLAVAPEPFMARHQPGETEVEAYYKEHQADFHRPTRVKAAYLLFKALDFQEKVNLTPADVDQYLNDHQEEFFQPRAIRARQIFLAVPAKAKEEERERVEEQAQDLWDQAMAEGADFSQLARAHSQDAATRDRGGDLGEVKRGQQPPEWEKTAFSLKPGEVGLATTPKGLYLIKVEGVTEKEKAPGAEAQAIQRLKAEKGRRLAREAAERARAELGPASLAEVGKKFGLSPQETPLISQKDAVPGLGLMPAFNQAALALKPGEFSKVVEGPAGFAILQGVEQQPEHVPPLGEIKDEVRTAVQKEQARAEAEKEAARVLESLRQGEPLAKAAAKAGLAVKETDFFSRSRGFPGQRRAEPLVQAAFRLSPEQPYPDKPILWEGQYYLLAFKARKAPSPEEFQKEKDKLRTQTLERKRQMLFADWLSRERQQAKIKLFELP
jgi:peptidyl-prolyl cis-trans isomerase D